MLSENMENKRLYYIDWLRVLVVLTLIPFHASLTYNASFTIYVFHYLPVTFLRGCLLTSICTYLVNTYWWWPCPT